MNSNEFLSIQNEFLIPTYSATLVLSRGQGSKIWDADGKEYLDFTSGISVCNLGHCHPYVTEAIQRQAAKLVHVSNLFVNEVQPQLAQKIAEISFGGRVFFANSGAEANEAMIKFARKWGSATGKYQIICMEHCFHGRTLATLSATDKPAIQEGFGPLVDGFSFVPFNDLEAIRSAITDETAAVMLEPVQGEAGVIPADPQYLAAVRELCDERGILLLFDEVQTGIGRTGEWFGSTLYDVVPDAMSMAKALGNGYPIGALEIQRKHEDVLGKSSHATTFGGTPLACAAGLATLNAMESNDVLFNTRDLGQHLKGALIQLAKGCSFITDVRGPGLMLGIEMDTQDHVNELIAKAQEKGLLLMAAAGQVVRVYPPLTVDKNTLDAGIEILTQALGELV